MKKSIGFFVVVMLFFVAFKVTAFEIYKSRITLAVHAKADLTDELTLHTSVFLAELQSGLFPSAFIDPRFKLISWFTFEPKLGWDFVADEGKICFDIMPAYGNFWTWGTVNMSVPSQNGYWFFEAEYNFSFWNRMVSMGLEGEGWGNYSDGKRWSNGGGPTIDWRFKFFELETSLQFRDYDRKAGIEFQIRASAHLGV